MTYFPTCVRKQQQGEENQLNNFGNSREELTQQFRLVHLYRNHTPINDTYKCVLLSKMSHECLPSSRTRVSEHQADRQALATTFPFAGNESEAALVGILCCL